MSTAHAEFQAAFKAWRTLTEAHEKRLQAALSGGPYDYDEAMAEVAEMRRLQDDFMEKSKPFVHWKTP